MKKEIFIVSVLWSPSDEKYYLIQRKNNEGWSLIGDRVKCDADLINMEETAMRSIQKKTGYANIEYKGELDRVNQDDSAISRIIHFYFFHLLKVSSSKKIKKQEPEKKENWFTFEEAVSKISPEISRRLLYEAERKIHTDEIITLSKPKIVVAAGPGTGKTFLFEKICKKEENDNNLVMTFINELTDDLKLKLEKLADVRTLHSFVMNILFPGSDKPKVFMKITDIISEDFNIIKKEEISFKDVFNDLLEKGNAEALSFYFKRREYYDSIGASCSVYDLIKDFKEGKKEIPQYSQILIDEFQDFNKLEIKLLDLLADESPILIVGDDDQSLYYFKNAYPGEIRSRCLDPQSDYLRRILPFCSRCPKVIIDSVKVLISRTKKNGLLKGRVPKKFEYFCSKEKDKTSKKYQKISYRGSVQYPSGLFIDQDIKKIFEEDKNFSVLIICAHGSPKRKDNIETYLRRKGFKNIQNKNISSIKMEGYNFLLKDHDCNLGWRILSKDWMEPDEFKKIIVKSESEQGLFKNLLPSHIRDGIVEVLKILKKIKDPKVKIGKKDRKIILDRFNYDPSSIAFNKLKMEIKESDFYKGRYKDIPVKIVNPRGSKGLSADYVFLVDYNESKVTDKLLCEFIVSITRTKKKLYIYSKEKNYPTFVKWIADYLDIL